MCAATCQANKEPVSVDSFFERYDLNIPYPEIV